AILDAGPAHGTLDLQADGSFDYTPDGNFHGSDAFQYRAGDGTTESAVVTVTITVRPLNAVPTAADDTSSTDQDTTLTVPPPGVLVNDGGAVGRTLIATVLSAPAHGTVVLRPDGSFTYTPSPNFNGVDAFTYRASDGSAPSRVATVSVTIRPVNDPPVVADLS